MVIVKFADNLSSGLIYREEKFDEDIDVELISEFIAKYKKENNDWQLDEMVDSCIDELKLKTYPMEDKIVIEV